MEKRTLAGAQLEKMTIVQPRSDLGLSLVDDLPRHECEANLARDFQPEKRRVLALAAQRAPFDLPVGLRIEDAYIGDGVYFQVAARIDQFCRLARDLRQRRRER